MNRRQLLSRAASLGALAAFSPRSFAQGKSESEVSPLKPPAKDPVAVAFVLGENANVIDTTGPWEVFQDAHRGDHQHNLFDVFTVGASTEPVTMTGGFRAVPYFTFANCPPPQVVVVPAIQGFPALHEWLRKVSEKNDVTMSVCTGAFQLARAGLLEGKSATTHHEFWDSFAKEFPKIDLKRGPRFVDNGRIATAGGLTSGFDLALHIVTRYYGREVAKATAAYMEYNSQLWQ